MNSVGGMIKGAQGSVVLPNPAQLICPVKITLKEGNVLQMRHVILVGTNGRAFMGIIEDINGGTAFVPNVDLGVMMEKLAGDPRKKEADIRKQKDNPEEAEQWVVSCEALIPNHIEIERCLANMYQALVEIANPIVTVQ